MKVPAPARALRLPRVHAPPTILQLSTYPMRRFVRDLNTAVQERSQAGLEQMREVCECALTAGGLHVSAGSRLWNIYRG
jgi:hypothetical protein